MRGIIVQNVANLYKVVEPKSKEKFDCVARGKFKNVGLSPVVGDIVDFSKENKVIENVYDRKNLLKRPKISNVSQIVFVLSMKSPTPDLLLLDKGLAFAENIGVKSIIVINKCDLVEDSKASEIAKIYENIGYKVIKAVAKQDKGIEDLKKALKGETSVFSGNSGVRKIYYNK